MKKITLLVFFGCLTLGQIMAQTGGLRGKVRSETGELLPFANIYIKNTQSGTASNADGEYEIRLPSGRQQVVFQFVGYQTVEKTVEIGTTLQTLDVAMPLLVYQLKEVEVRAGREDPAYTIMRKAIAKAKIHKLQVDAYDCRVYLKGTGRVLDIPWVAEGRLKKEGVVKGKTYLSETVADLHFEQPNVYKQKVLAMRSSDIDPKNVSPMDYVNATFYDPDVAGTVSPLAPSSFAYYAFKLENTFRDRNYTVNKIRVIPRSKGDDVWGGYIYIVEDKWCIHSLQLDTEKLGFKVHIEQTYAPVEADVFMPVGLQARIGGRYLGFEGEFSYVASLSNYKVKLNPKFIPEVKLIDEKIERERAEQAKKIAQASKKAPSADPSKELEEALNEGRELRRKDLKKMMKQAEKEQLAQERKAAKAKNETPPSEITSNYSLTIDSLATKKATTFWDTLRPIPLTQFETKSYTERDSLRRVDSLDRAKSKAPEDSTLQGKPKKRKRFGFGDVFTGYTFRTGKQSSFEYSSLLQNVNFNTVEGYAMNLRLTYRRSFARDTVKRTSGQFSFSPLVRYSFARNVLLAKADLKLRPPKWRTPLLWLDGGRFVEQLNPQIPLPPFLNTLTTLLLEQNFMKLYERDYVRARFERELFPGFTLNAAAELAQRRQLNNNSDWRLINWREREYTPNQPENSEFAGQDLGLATFPDHRAALLSLAVDYKPLIRYRMRNGRKIRDDEASPVLRLQYRKGLADADFDFLSLGIQHQAKMGIRGKLGYAVTAGRFFNRNRVYFPDFAHFLGNRVFVQFTDPVRGFRMLDYYRASTSQEFLEAHGYLQFRKLLLTQFFALRALGIKENIFAHYLLTPTIHNYTEVGYTLDGVLRLFRLEGVAVFENGQYRDWGIRLGITTTFGFGVGVGDD
ncbi:MAG: DUF5686 family protein [Bernardetiaceae bacterium]|jgi:hypothetical protein|nr:DUF5686 family protein [Bernardetiaceae bacterium]